MDQISSLYDAKSGFPRSVKVWNIVFSFFWPQAVPPVAKKKETKKSIAKTLNDGLPPENGSHSPQTLAKRISDDSQHFIFQLPKKTSSGFFDEIRQFFIGF